MQTLPIELIKETNTKNIHRFYLKHNPKKQETLETLLKQISKDPIDISHLSKFSQEVLYTLKKTNIGDCLTYQELAEKIGNKNKARAVGRALAENPYPLYFPCHRIEKKGKPTFNYSATKEKSEGSLIKQVLTNYEKETIEQTKASQLQ